MALSDLVVVMDGGRIVQKGDPRAVFNRPANAFVARFIGGHNVISSGGRPIVLRSDQIVLAGSGEGREGASCPGTVSDIEYLGALVRVRLATAGGDEIVAEIPDHLFDASPREIGDAVLATWNPAQAHPLD